MKHLRVYLSGASGLGKTTLAKLISKELGLPYINTSSSNVWGEFGVKSHEHALQLSGDYNWAHKYQMAILENRKKILGDNDNFVTDRSIIDNLIYYMDGNKPYQLQREYNKTCIEMLQHDLENYNVVFIRLIRPFSWETENDGKRIADEGYQIKSNLLFKGFDFRYFMENVKHYYHEQNIPFEWGNLKFLGRKNIIREATIHASDFKKRFMAVSQIIENIGGFEGDEFSELYEYITYNDFNHEDYR